MFLGWYDPDKKAAPAAKLAAAVARYRVRFGADPELAMTSPEDGRLLLDGGHDAEALPIRTASFIPRHTYYVGKEG